MKTPAKPERALPAWALILLLGAFASLTSMSVDMYLPALPQIAVELQAPAHAVTATLSLFIGGLGIGQLLAGPWSDRVGRRPPVLWGLGVYLAGSLAIAVAGGIELFLVGRLLQALGASAVTVTGRAVVRDLYQEHDAARFLAATTLITGLMPIIAPLAGTAVLAVAGWRAIFLVTALAAAPLLIAAALWLPESRSHATRERAHGRHPLRTYAEMLRDRRLLGFLLAAGCNAACFFTYLGSSPLVLMNTYHLGPSTYSTAVAINALGLLGASQLNRGLLRTRRPQAILAGSARNAVLLGLAYIAFAATLWGGLPVLLLLFFLAVASLSIVQNNTLACALSVDPQRAGAAAALFGAATFGMGTLMSYLAGWLYDGTARPMTLVIALNLLGAAAALRWLALPPARARC